MKSTLAAAVAVMLLCAASASAGTITSISPSSVKVNSGEHFMTVYGTGLGTVMVFDGPAGHFEVNTNANFTGSVVGWVPERIVQVSGTYSMYVRGGTGDSNSVTFTVQGLKFFPLVLLMPEVLRVQPSSRDGGYAKYEVIAVGGEDPNPTVSCDIPSGSYFKMGLTTVNCVAQNIYNESARGSFQVHMFDHVAPKLTLPAPIQVRATSREGAIVDFKPSASDAIYGEVLVECLPRSGSVFPIGKTNVQCLATDPDQNVANGSFLVDVLGDVEWYPLTLHVPRPIFVDADSPDGTPVKYDVRVTGTKDQYPTLTCSHKSGQVFSVGTTTVNCEAIDYNGMRGRGDFEVTVVDPYPPEILRLYVSPEVLYPADGRIIPVNLDVSVYDKIDIAPVCAVFSVTANQNIDVNEGPKDDPKNYNWAITGPMSVELRAAYTRTDRVYHVWVGCTDYFGNRTTQAAYVTVPAGAALTTGQPQPGRRRSVRP
jgi:hypothetical protein